MFSQRNNVRRLFRVAKKLRGNESGVTLLETLVALAVLGLVAVAFLNGLTTAAQATIIADKQATAESLVRSEIECVKSQDYKSPGQGPYQNREQRYEFVMPTGYSVEIDVTPIDPDTGEDLSPGLDVGIQKITVAVKRNNNPVLTVEDYKVDR